MYQGNKNKFVFLVSGGALIVCAVIFFAVPFFVRPKIQLPQQFLNARQGASLVSKDIVALTTKTNELIQEIGRLDFSKDKERAILLVNEARESNKEAYAKAFALSQNLQDIAQSLAGIPSEQSRRIAYDAVATELSLVSQFIAYTQSLQSFLDTISGLIQSNSNNDRAAVQENLDSVNEKTRVINQLNADFLSKMQEFEASL